MVDLGVYHSNYAIYINGRPMIESGLGYDSKAPLIW